MKQLLLVLLTALVALAVPSASAAKQRPTWHTESISDEVEAEIATFPSDGRFLVLWIAPGYGTRPEHMAFGAALAAEGLEVWITDLVDAYFLPRNRNALLRVDADAVASLVKLASERSGKAVVLMGTGDAAIPVLRGARAWQLKSASASGLIGAVLLSPELYRGVPRLGAEPEYLPIVGATHVPVAVFQSGKRTGGRRLPALLNALNSGGAPVYAQLMPEVGILFAQEALSSEARTALAELPAKVRRILPLLEKTDYAKTPAALAQPSVTDRPGLDSALRGFPGTPPASAIRLTDIDGKNWRIEDYQDRVTVINFWATWCPPCVEEIPALTRMRNAMRGMPFELISIDFGESPDVVKSFLGRVDVDFPVLLDADGSVGADWKVIALPSTFIVGPDGAIRYGANGAIHWDSTEVIEQLTALGRQPAP